MGNVRNTLTTEVDGARGARIGRMAAALVLNAVPIVALATAMPDEIGGDNFDGFDLTPCDATLASNSAAPSDYAAALDLCATTTGASHAPGLVSATLSRVDGSGTPYPTTHSIRPSYGTGITPRRGSALALLSTGSAAGVADVNPSFGAPQPGVVTGTTSALPADWLAANGGKVPNLPGCPDIATSAANDPVMLTLRIRVPNNAHSFSLDGDFLTAEFPEWTCSPFNDVFVALLDSDFGAALNPPDKDLATFDGAPAFVNLAALDNGTFTQCTDGTIGCASGNTASITTCSNTGQLVGTGMDAAASSNDSCARAGGQVGGGTGWFVMRGNVVPGDIIELRLAIWDSGDGSYDSDIVLDNFRWAYQPVQAGATILP